MPILFKISRVSYNLSTRAVGSEVERLVDIEKVAGSSPARPTMRGWVYILKLSSGKYYLGSTSNLIQRLQTHRSGKSSYTSKFLPIELMFSQEYSDYFKAKRVELWLKGLKSKVIIERIIVDGKILKEI